MKAVIPAAGLGTRFLPATKASPKEMLPVLDKPAIQYAVEECAASGIDEVVLVTAPAKRALLDHFRPSPGLEALLERRGDLRRLEAVRGVAAGLKVRSVLQREPLGLGHAVLCARRLVGDEPFALLLGDDLVTGKVPATRQLVAAHAKAGHSVVGVEEVAPSRLHLYGVVEPARAARGTFPVKAVVEKPQPGEAPSRLGVMGRYVFEPEVFAELRRTPPGRGGEVQLSDAMDSLARRGRLSAHAVRGRRHDLGSKAGWLQANLEFGWRDPECRAALQGTLARLQGSRRVPRGKGTRARPA